MKGYRKFQTLIPCSLLETFAKDVLSKRDNVCVQVQFLPKGTPSPKSDGGTSYSKKDRVALSLFTGGVVLSPTGFFTMEEVKDE